VGDPTPFRSLSAYCAKAVRGRIQHRYWLLQSHSGRIANVFENETLANGYSAFREKLSKVFQLDPSISGPVARSSRFI
jgi:hypothetical protein